jgi:hypothetical protein
VNEDSRTPLPSFLPCNVQAFPFRQASRVPLWIVFAGTSIIRGTFLTVASRLGMAVDKEALKCWGWLDLRHGNFRKCRK